MNLAGLYPRHDLYGNAHFGASSSPVVDFLIPRAHASGSSSFVWGLINRVIPLESFGILFQQLSYLATDPDKFEADEFVIALVDAITIFPPAKGLKLFTTPLKAMTRAQKGINPKFMKHFGGYLNRVMQKAKKGDFDTLWNTLPFLVIAAEMYTDEDARKGLEFLMSTVDSADDIVAWVDYLALPVGGWEGEGQPLQVDAFGNTEENASILSFFIQQAYAAPKLRRVSGRVIGASLARIAKRIARENVESLPDALAVATKQLRNTDFKKLREYEFKPSMLAATVGLATKRGASALNAFTKGKTNARYSLITIMATVAYLEWEAACGKALEIKDGEESAEERAKAETFLTELECNGKGLRGKANRRELINLYSRAFADSLSRTFDETPPSEDYSIRPYGHGALFHMNQIAMALLEQRAGGKALKAIEGSRWIWLYKDEAGLDEAGIETSTSSPTYRKNVIQSYNRRIDIILGNEGEAEQWIELKSYAMLCYRKQVRVVRSWLF